jgi:hypothetical protein
MSVQYPAPTVPVVAQPIIVCDANGNPLNSSAVGNNVNLNQVGGSAFATGQQNKAGSIPVVLPSDQTVPVSTGIADIVVLASGSGQLPRHKPTRPTSMHEASGWYST